MAVGLRVRVVNTQDGSVLDRTFDRSPVRIGRSSLNELQIQAPFVSQYHAVIEFDGLKLQVRDLGSTNGTSLRASGRVPPNTVIDLTKQNYEFAIVSLWFQVFSVAEVAPATSERKREGTVLSMDAAALARMMADPSFGTPGGATGASPAKPAGTATREETVALQALRDLAAAYVPHRPLERVVDVVAFAQKMQDVLDVFFKCFLPLRDGHKQFQTQMDIKKTRLPNEAINASRAVETAREPRELAARVLDWGDPSNEGSRAIESTFAEVMVHQVAMLNGVMRGVRSLLGKLAPASIEAESANPRRRSGGGMQLGPFRYKALWELYVEVYGDFAEDEKQAFMLIFGAEFVHAYSELAGEAPMGKGTSLANAPHAFAQARAAVSARPASVPPPPMGTPPPIVNSPPQPTSAPGQAPAPAPIPPWGVGPWPGGPPRR